MSLLALKLFHRLFNAFSQDEEATRVKYGPYITGSLLGMVPEVFFAIYTLAQKIVQGDVPQALMNRKFARENAKTFGIELIVDI